MVGKGVIFIAAGEGFLISDGDRIAIDNGENTRTKDGVWATKITSQERRERVDEGKTCDKKPCLLRKLVAVTFT